MDEFQDEAPVLTFIDWADDLDALVGGTLELMLRGKLGNDRGHFRGKIKSIRLSGNGQFIVELENRRVFVPKQGRWQTTDKVERLLHPTSSQHVGFVMGPFVLNDGTIFWTYGKEPFDPTQCVWIFPPEVTVPHRPFSEEEVVGLLGIFIEVVLPSDVQFNGKEWPTKLK